MKSSIVLISAPVNQVLPADKSSGLALFSLAALRAC
nr:MAG TPA: hypothetical protein [Caudoviricetes sp.]